MYTALYNFNAIWIPPPPSEYLANTESSLVAHSGGNYCPCWKSLIPSFEYHITLTIAKYIYINKVRVMYLLLELTEPRFVLVFCRRNRYLVIENWTATNSQQYKNYLNVISPQFPFSFLFSWLLLYLCILLGRFAMNIVKNFLRCDTIRRN